MGRSIPHPPSLSSRSTAPRLDQWQLSSSQETSWSFFVKIPSTSSPHGATILEAEQLHAVAHLAWFPAQVTFMQSNAPPRKERNNGDFRDFHCVVIFLSDVI